MKKLLIGIVVVAAAVGGYVWLRTWKMEFQFLDPKFGKVRRGDLVIPIKASGKVQPKGRREIKSKASGEIIVMRYEEGQLVRRGDVLVELKRDDEERNCDTAEAALTQAEIALATAKINHEQAKEAGLPAATAAQARAEAQRDRFKVDYEFKKNLQDKNPAAVSTEELLVLEAQYKESEAAVASAAAEVTKARIAVDMAQKKIEEAQAALVTAQRKVEEAKERLSETTIKSPIDGMVLQRLHNVGEMIQSGTASFTGGTVLMTLADVSEVYMVASVDEADIGKVREMAPKEARPGADPNATTRPTTQPVVTQDTIKEGTLVDISVEAFPDEKFHGVIERIAPETEVRVDVATFEVRIRIVSENRDDIRNLVGMQAEATFTSVPMTNVLLVPYEAVHRGKGDELGVYVPVRQPEAVREEPEFRACKFGPDNGIDVVVLEGVEEGQVVYTKLPILTEAEKKEKGETDGSEL